METMMDNSKIKLVDISNEMENSYIDYAMSVIAGRALPDVRDGLKPVHRRILYAMSQLNLDPNKPHRKSARIVGDVLGKYHPHGDSSVYGAMVRLAQDFSIRYLLVDGHGNFGSVDGDSAAAMRYTEARMTNIAVELLRDINKDTVPFVKNFDESLEEPSVLPSKLPTLLLNGSNGIAVGMATSIPPHNMNEVIDACLLMLEKNINGEVADIEELISLVKGPDFPTGGIIQGKANIKEAYRTGQGKVLVRAKTEIEESKKGRHQIVITEIPYQVNKARLIEKIAELVRDKKIEHISDLRDESNRKGMRVVIELKKDANPHIVLNRLYKHTQMQDTFSIIMLALVDGEPKLLNLSQILEHYLNHQRDIITRRTRFDLNKAEERAHILEGLKIALDNIDAVIKLIRSAKNDSDAKTGLMEKFSLSEKQAQAILDMRLRRLTGLERDKIDAEYKELLEKIEFFKSILNDEKVLLSIIQKELTEIKEKYGDERRTEITIDTTNIEEEDLIQETDVVITLTHSGYIKRLSADTYRNQKRGGRGIMGMTTKEDDFVKQIISTSTHNYLMFFTTSGKVYRKKAYEIPEAVRTSKGSNIVNLLDLNPGERVAAVFPVREFNTDEYLVMVTKKGVIKKTDMAQLDTSRKSGLIVINLKDGDGLIAVRKTTGNSDIILVTKQCKCICFSEEDVRSMGRNAAGVRGIQLDGEDEVVSMEIAKPNENEQLLVVSKYGYGKRTPIEEYKVQNRGGKGVLTYSNKRMKKTGELIGAISVNEQDSFMIINSNGVIIKLNASDVSSFSRDTSGVKVMRVDEGVYLQSLAKVSQDEVDEGETFEDTLQLELE